MVLVKYTDGTILRGILLVLWGAELRIAVSGCDDIAVFRLVKQRWLSQDCDVVTFEFPTAVLEAIGMTPANQQHVSEAGVSLGRTVSEIGRRVN